MAEVAGPVGTVLSIVGNIQQGNAAERSGLEEQLARQYEAEQLKVDAGQAVAAAQRDAMEQRRQGELLQSRAIALAAASGGGVTDPSVVKLLSSNAGEIAYRSAVAIYRGEDEARSLNAKAAAALYSGARAADEGRDRQKAYMTRAFGDLVKGGSSLYETYWPKEGAK